MLYYLYEVSDGRRVVMVKRWTAADSHVLRRSPRIGHRSADAPGMGLPRGWLGD